MDRSEKLKLLKMYHKNCQRRFDQWVEGDYSGRAPVPTTFPAACIDMRCEAKTRSGHPCKNEVTAFDNGRCRFHGGLSTGPKSAEGKRRSALNGLKRWLKDGE